MSSFRSPEQFLAGLDAEMTGRVIASATDLALIVQEGVIRDIAVASDELSREGYGQSWRGQPWIETVTVESRPKVERILREAASLRSPARQVNHPSAAGMDVPIRYTAVQTRPDCVVALGRDLRENSRLQQRLIEAHQRLERDYASLRDTEARYRVLFDAVSNPVLIVEPEALSVLEANRQAVIFFDGMVEPLMSTPLDQQFVPDSRSAVTRTVTEAAYRGEASTSDLHTLDGRVVDLSGSTYRDARGTRVIVRLTPEPTSAPGAAHEPSHDFMKIWEVLPDGLVVVGSDQRILMANRTFAAMAQLPGDGNLLGSRVSDLLGRSTTEINVLIANLRKHGVVRNFATVLRNRFGDEEEVEVSAVVSPNGPDSYYGMSIRNVARRIGTAVRTHDGLPNSAEQIARLVGRVPLREIVRESTDFIEKLCIEAALDITGDNRASASEILGLSRQSLYAKLKRFGIEDAD